MLTQTHEAVVLFNIAYTLITLLISFFIFYFYKILQPKYYGLLFFAAFIAVISCFFLGFYNNALELFNHAVTSTPIEENIKTDMVQSLKVLVFIVPGIMAAVSANLVTEFMLKRNPSSNKRL